MKFFWYSLLISICTTSISQAQILDEETGFIYVKAEYLLETARYDEAVANYNKIITKDPAYKDALIHRGYAKYALGAFKGAKNDALQCIDLKGIQAESAGLLGKSCVAMNEKDAAVNSLTAAILLDNKNPAYLLLRASVYESSNQTLKACADYEAAMKLGSPEAEVKARNLCGVTRPQKNTTDVVISNVPSQSTGNPETKQDQPVVTHTQPSATHQNDSTTVNIPPSSGNSDPGVQVVQDTQHKVDEGKPSEDNTINQFVIDEDLSISVYGQELGHRKIKEVPSILILSDESGKVSVNICVNKDGVVYKAEFNATMSTIAQKSLVSLALRKAKEFEFEPNKYETQCGVMIFDIKGS
jgi:tetratricopeptide (TPR) repeat protein